MIIDCKELMIEIIESGNTSFNIPVLSVLNGSEAINQGTIGVI